MNEYERSIGKSVRDIGHIENFKPDLFTDEAPEWTRRLEDMERYHSLFISWPSGGPDTYFDRIYRYDQGAYDNDFKSLTGFLDIFSDLATSVTGAPRAYINSGARYDDAETNVRERAEGKADPFDEICKTANDANFLCGRDIEQDLTVGSTALFQATLPARMLTVPVLEPVGLQAWNSMLARTRFTFRRPHSLFQSEKIDDFLRYNKGERIRRKTEALGSKTNDSQPQNDINHGILYRFFSMLQNKMCGTKTRNAQLTSSASCAETTGVKPPRITIVGHSMGAIVTNEILFHFPCLPYRNIVFMAAANSIRDFRLMWEPLLRHRVTCETNPQDCLPALRRLDLSAPVDHLRFYNLTLHPIADETETNLYGAAPRGSLLEWIDDLFTTPPVFADRTMGKWKNVVLAYDDFDPATLKRTRFKRFGLSCASPREHGGFRQHFPPAEKDKPPTLSPQLRIDESLKNRSPDETRVCNYTKRDGSLAWARAWQYWDPRYWPLDNVAPGK